MELISQEINSLLELLDRRMADMNIVGHGRGKKLAQMAGLPESTVSRLLNGSKQVKVDSIFKVLQALGLLKELEPIPKQIDPEIGEAVKIVEEIMTSGDEVVIPALKSNLYAFQMTVRANRENTRIKEESRKMKSENNKLRKTLSTLEKEVDYLKHINHPPVFNATGTEGGPDI